MTAKVTKRRNKDYGPLKTALAEHINALPLDLVFYVSDLIPVAEKHGFTATDLPYAMASITRSGIIEHVGMHKKDYQKITHLRRAKDPKPRIPKTRTAAEYMEDTVLRAKRMEDACMRLWSALGMPQVQRDPRVMA